MTEPSSRLPRLTVSTWPSARALASGGHVLRSGAPAAAPPCFRNRSHGLGDAVYEGLGRRESHLPVSAPGPLRRGVCSAFEKGFL